MCKPLQTKSGVQKVLVLVHMNTPAQKPIDHIVEERLVYFQMPPFVNTTHTHGDYFHVVRIIQ